MSIWIICKCVSHVDVVIMVLGTLGSVGEWITTRWKAHYHN